MNKTIMDWVMKMYYHYFKLDEYFEKTKKHYLFFDGIFVKRKIKKAETLDLLDIPGSTYRTNKAKELTRNKSTIEVLMNYFEISNLQKDKQIYYERVISTIFSDYYYKNEDKFNDHIKLLDECIGENTILTPVFVLFKLYLITSNYTLSKERLNILVEDLMKDLVYFEAFFTEELRVIYKLLLLFVDEKNSKTKIIELVNLCNTYKFIEGVLHFYLTSYYFFQNEYARAIIHGKKAEAILEKESNFNRLIAIRINLCSLYNHLEEYESTIKISSQLFIYFSNNPKYDSLSKFVKTHYMIAMANTNNFGDIINYTERNIHTITFKYIDICLLILSYYVVDKLNWVKRTEKFLFDNGGTLEEYEVLITHLKMNKPLETPLKQGRLWIEVQKILAKITSLANK